MRWTEHVTCVRKRREIHTVFGVLEIEHVEDLGVDGNGKLKCVVEKQNSVAWIKFIWLKTGRS